MAALRAVAVLGGVGLVLLLGTQVLAGSGPDIVGPTEGSLLNAADVQDGTIVIRVPPDEIDELEVTLNGDGIGAILERHDDGVAIPLEELDDGEHHLRARTPGLVGGGSSNLRFAIDATPPQVELAEVEGPLIGDEPLDTTGSIDDPDAELTVQGATLNRDGTAFSISAPGPITEPVRVTATDAAGNVNEVVVDLASVPSRVRVRPLRAVHVSYYGWANESLREPILAMIDAGLINAVQLDIKSESGVVGYSSNVPRAQEIGAVEDIYDLRAAIAELHARDVMVIGRIVAFRDPILSAYAWDNDERDQVVQTPEGEPYGGYGGFTNFANDAVRQYNIDLAIEAARMGVDDILWDYVRRPDGPLETFRFPGIEGTPEEAVIDFVAQADRALAPFGVEHGASVYGIAVDRPDQIGQDIEAMVEYTDYIAPMVYPSHWGPGEYGIASPVNDPYGIVYESMIRFNAVADGRRARMVPWLQDFSMGGVTYDAAKVRAQIEATYETGVDEWLLWAPNNVYTAEAITPLSQ